MRDRLAVLDEIRNDVLAEVVGRVGVRRITPQLVQQELRLENIDAHAGERSVGLSGHRRRILGLFHKGPDDVIPIGIHDPETGCLNAGNLDAADRHIGILLRMLLQHGLVIHFVDVIASQHHKVFRVVTFDNVQVLVNGVGSALIPELLAKCAGSRAKYRSSRCEWGA